MKEVVKEYVIELGLEVVKDRLLEEKDRITARERLKTFVEKQTVSTGSIILTVTMTERLF